MLVPCCVQLKETNKPSRQEKAVVKRQTNSRKARRKKRYRRKFFDRFLRIVIFAFDRTPESNHVLPEKNTKPRTTKGRDETQQKGRTEEKESIHDQLWKRRCSRGCWLESE
jgi:hypothetical protein